MRVLDTWTLQWVRCSHNTKLVRNFRKVTYVVKFDERVLLTDVQSHFRKKFETNPHSRY
jgi:hypothetical protein